MAGAVADGHKVRFTVAVSAACSQQGNRIGPAVAGFSFDDLTVGRVRPLAARPPRRGAPLGCAISAQPSAHLPIRPPEPPDLTQAAPLTNAGRVQGAENLPHHPRLLMNPFCSAGVAPGERITPACTRLAAASP